MTGQNIQRRQQTTQFASRPGSGAPSLPRLGGGEMRSSSSRNTTTTTTHDASGGLAEFVVDSIPISPMRTTSLREKPTHSSRDSSSNVCGGGILYLKEREGDSTTCEETKSDSDDNSSSLLLSSSNHGSSLGAVDQFDEEVRTNGLDCFWFWCPVGVFCVLFCPLSVLGLYS